MKKLFVFVAILFVLSGCDTTDTSLMTMSCNSNNNDTNGISRETKYDFKYEDGKVKYVTMTYHYRDNNNLDIDGINADTDGLDEHNSNNNARNRNATDGTTDDNMNDNTNGTAGGTTTDGMNGNTNGTYGGTTTNGNNDNTRNGNDNGTTGGTTNNGTDATTNGTNGMTNNNSNAGLSGDNIVDGVVGDTIDGIINTVTDTIYDIAGLRTTLERQYSSYENIDGLSYDVDTSSDTEYKVVFKIDMDVISDDNLARFNLDRNLDNVRDNYEGLGYTCR